MTAQQKILVFGTSHVASLRAAKDQIELSFPQISLTYYGLPGGLFDRSLCEENVLFGPASTDTQGLSLSQRINGCEKVDLSAFDQLFLVGAPMGQGWLYRTGRQYQVQGTATEDTDKPLVSWSFFESALKATLQTALRKIQTQTGAPEKLKIAPRPWPSEALARGKERDAAIATFHRQPEHKTLIESYDAAVSAACTEQNLGYIRRPKATLSEPGLTKNEYALDTIRLHPDLKNTTDYKHMNAAYGLAAFTEYAAASGIEPDHSFTTNIKNTKER